MDALQTLSAINQGITLAEKVNKMHNLSYALSCKKHKLDYIILNLKKDVTVYGNGNGIIICSFEFYVMHPEKMKYINMRLNIDDACYGVTFDTLVAMSQCPERNRFSTLGFWFDCTDNCVEKVEEYYWRDDGEDGEDQHYMNNKREIRYRFVMRPENMKRGGVYSVTYSFSVPEMYPITECKYNPTKATINHDKMESSYNVRHHVRCAEYIVSFEKGIEFKERPQGEVKIQMGNTTLAREPLSPENVSDLFYRRYKYVVKKPKLDSYIGISWKVN